MHSPLRTVVALAMLTACSTSEAARPDRAPTSATPPLVSMASSSVVDVALPAVHATYPWAPRASGPSDRLDGRFRSAPAGFTRVPVAAGSFGEFLRTLPLQPEGAPVVDYRGNRLHADGRHPNIVAVADLDIGAKDLQHCADAIIRLNAEWRYGRGQRDITYRAVSGQTLSYRGWVAGDRSRVVGKNLVFERAAAPQRDDHALFRGWLDDVFSWAGTASLERDGSKVHAAAEMLPGDFFVMSGSPFGHAVLVLDVARDEHGRAAVLLGQSYMPAQSFQVLARDESAWFTIEPGDAFVTTPFWRPFPMTALRRFG
jgi:hypothetical protein